MALTSSLLFSQILSVNSGASISMAPGSSVTLDGLEIAPSQTHIITDSYALYRSSDPITSADASSINRVYSSSALLTDFVGTINFSFDASELNDITESDLVLELQGEDDAWTSFTGIVDEVNNTISYTFTEAISFKAITASSSNSTLTIENLNFASSKILVYPNPTVHHIYIKTDSLKQAELFDMTGRRVKTTSRHEIDASFLEQGTYMLKVTTQNNQANSFKIIKQ